MLQACTPGQRVFVCVRGGVWSCVTGCCVVRVCGWGGGVDDTVGGCLEGVAPDRCAWFKSRELSGQ